MERPPDPILSFQEISFPAGGRYDAGFEGSLAVGAGELVAIGLEPHAPRTPVADLAQGLVAPASGRVLFLGEDWRKLRPEEAARRRARIGRVFEGWGWISNLDVIENITLPARHHTARPVEEILADAEALARRFGLPGIPAGRPAAVGRSDLRKSEWVRAFLDSPVLLLLEHPALRADEADLASLLEAIGEARGRGAAVVWLDDGPSLAGLSLQPTRRARMEGSRILLDEGGG